MKKMVIYFTNGLEVSYEFKNLIVNCGVDENAYIAFCGRRKTTEEYQHVLIQCSKIDWFEIE